MNVQDRLVARSDTLVIVEHHPWVIADADHIVSSAAAQTALTASFTSTRRDRAYRIRREGTPIVSSDIDDLRHLDEAAVLHRN